MRFLFVHTNFPGQFRHIAPALVQRGHEVVCLGSDTARPLPGVRLIQYSFTLPDVSATHPFARSFDINCHRAEQIFRSLRTLNAEGFTPDVIVVHPGWGEALPLRMIFRDARIIAYCEFYYCHSGGADLEFDPEFPVMALDSRVGLNLRNAANLLALAESDAAIAPTQWQRSIFPREFHSKISVVHEGIHTDVAAPSTDAFVQISNGPRLTLANEVITYVARNLEPVRGFHIFMRSLPEILRRRPNAHVLIVGGDDVSYGARAPEGKTWRDVYLDEIRGSIDPARVHFTGILRYVDYLQVLKISTVHVYLTHPFVLSWSMLEALSTGCLLVGSDTGPVQEVIDGSNGLLVPFLDVDALSLAVADCIEKRESLQGMRDKARRDMIDRFDLNRRCLPDMLALLGA